MHQVPKVLSRLDSASADEAQRTRDTVRVINGLRRQQLCAPLAADSGQHSIATTAKRDLIEHEVCPF